MEVNSFENDSNNSAWFTGPLQYERNDNKGRYTTKLSIIYKTFIISNIAIIHNITTLKKIETITYLKQRG